MENFIRILRAEDVNNVLEGNEKEVIEIVKDAYIMHNENLTSLPHSIFLRFPNDNVNRIIGLPAYVGGDVNMAGMKWISSFPNNTKNGIERASAVTILNNMETGRCETILEGSIISAKRTAASAASKLHSNPKEEILGVVGCGRISREIIKFILAEFPTIKNIVFYDLYKEKAEEMAELMSKSGMTTEVVTSIEEVFEKCKLVVFATTAGVPYINKIEHVDSDTTILNISLRDFSPEVVEACDNVVDDVDHVLRERTSVHLTEQKLNTRDFIRCPLADILSGKQNNRVDGKPVMFSPFGLGILDIALSNYVYAEAEKAGYGVVVENFLP